MSCKTEQKAHTRTHVKCKTFYNKQSKTSKKQQHIQHKFALRVRKKTSLMEFSCNFIQFNYGVEFSSTRNSSKKKKQQNKKKKLKEKGEH